MSKRLVTHLDGKVRPGCKRFASGCGAVFGCALIAGSMFAAPLKADSHSAEKHKPAPKHRLRGVPQFAQVTPTLYRGAQPTAEGFASLDKLGVNIVVDLRGSRASERKLVTRLGM